jgi:hypothetical protein
MTILLSRITGNEENMSRPVYLGLLALWGALAFVLFYAIVGSFSYTIFFEDSSFSYFLSMFWEYFTDAIGLL